jgi:FkbM family methyltransferase
LEIVGPLIPNSQQSPSAIAGRKMMSHRSARLIACLLKRLPLRIGQSFYYRFFRNTSASRPTLFRAAPLRFAPGVVMDLLPGDECHGVIAHTGVYELQLTRRLLREAHRGGLLVDVGANFGYYSLLWAGQGLDCSAMAFEPSPSVFSALCKNISQNHFSERITAHSFAVGQETSSVRFLPSPPGQTGWGQVVEANEGSILVPSTTLDQELKGMEEVNVLKIDAEGADFQALLGAEECLRRRIFRNIFWEASTDRLEEADARRFYKLAAECGYALSQLNPQARGGTIFEGHRIS